MPAQSRTFWLLLGLSSLWLVAWVLAGYAMHSAGSGLIGDASRIEASRSVLEPGGLVREEAIVADGPTVVSPYGERPCLAAATYVSLVGRANGAHDREKRTTALVERRTTGPAELGMLVGQRRLALPIERWTPKVTDSPDMLELPARIAVSPNAIANARKSLEGRLYGYSIGEATLDAGARVFVVGRLEPRTGPLVLDADPDLGRVEVFPGTRDEYLADLRDDGAGLRLSGWVFGAGIGPLPVWIAGLVRLARRRRAGQQAHRR
jgi:hypothetical protein